VVLYDLPVYKENIRSCEAVFAVEIGDYRGIAGKTIELLSNDAFREYEAIGSAFVARYNWDVISQAEFRILTETG